MADRELTPHDEPQPEKRGDWIREVKPTDTKSIRMLSQALTRGYPMTPEIREMVILKLVELLETSTNERTILNAIKGLIAADKANIALMSTASAMSNRMFGGGDLDQQLAELENAKGLTQEYRDALKNLLLAKAGMAPKASDDNDEIEEIIDAETPEADSQPSGQEEQAPGEGGGEGTGP